MHPDRSPFLRHHTTSISAVDARGGRETGRQDGVGVSLGNSYRHGPPIVVAAQLPAKKIKKIDMQLVVSCYVGVVSRHLDASRDQLTKHEAGVVLPIANHMMRLVPAAWNGCWAGLNVLVWTCRPGGSGVLFEGRHWH